MRRPETNVVAARSKATKLKKKKKKIRTPVPTQSKLTKEQKAFLDYKDIDTLSKFVSGVGKILPRKRSGATHREQQAIRDAIKMARFMALLPYVSR
ncbi:MAG: 30S ribosomal protein S18 [Planctomycetes bacterium]|jgi:small subunit ribosomal protein S18|nr:30S ribosomal protein S18 [Planctomycetota bacterium]MCL4730593.1 30S ribosomal protein S18 [Planctomycetota bacterium]